MKKHAFLILLLATCTIFNSFAGVVNQQKAQTVALNFYKNTAGSSNNASATLKYTKTDANGAVSFYVFDMAPAKGFVIVTAADNAEPILGYSTESNFSTDHLEQSGLSDWMSTTSTKIQKIVQMQIPADTRISKLWNNYTSGAIVPNSRASAVAPLVTTKWNQNPYYNALCPYNTTYSTNAVTGCVATAMAQIMKFWNWPATGTGSYSYNAGNYGTLSANFANSTYQWSAMPTTVNSTNYTPVAKLMSDCGIAVAMDYGTINEGGSGAYVLGTSYPSAQKAFGTYFSYNASLMKGVYQKNYSATDWAALLQNELNAGRPIQYMGFDPGGGGHTWVCDGYDATGLLHMNWGWGGYSDGYFTVTNLAAGGYNFSTDEAALIGIQPNSTGTTCGVPTGLAYSSIATTTATVSWAAVSGAVSYNLQYKPSTSSTWNTLSVSSTSSNLTGLTAGTTYNFQVQTTCSGGSSAYSTASSFTTTAAATCGVPGTLSATSVTTTSATLSWAAVSGATSYKLQYKTAASSTWNTLTVTSTSSSLTGLTSGTTYNYQVSATCASGTSAYSTASSFTTLSSCGTPSGLTAAAITSSGATVSWAAVTGAISYNLQYKASSASTWSTLSVSSTSTTLSSLSASTSYNFQVSAVCSSGSSAYSTASSFTTSAAAITCGTALGITVSGITTNSALIVWLAVSGATSYNLQYKATSASTWTTVPLTALTYTLNGLTPGTSYNYQIQTVCSVGSSTSSASSFSTLSSCGTPSGLASTSITASGATVSWSAISGATSYNLQYKTSSSSTWNTLSVTSTSSSLTGLTAGTSYNFQVAAICASGTSVYSTAGSFTTLTNCGIPASLSATNITTAGATVSWGAVSGATTYNLQYKTTAGTTWLSISTSNTSYALTGLAAGTAYSFQVSSTCASGTSAYSTAGSFTTTTAGAVTYCTSKATSTMFEYIKAVAIGSFSNTSGNNSGYGSYTNLTIPFKSGSTRTFTLTPGFSSSSYPEYWTIFVDYNKNGVFTDAGEKVYTSPASQVAVTGSITVPAGLSGTSTMRIVMTYSTGASPCGNYYFGESEDYTVDFSSINTFHAIGGADEEEAVNVDNSTQDFVMPTMLYPNPATEQVRVRLTPLEDLEQRVEVMSLTGQLVFSQVLGPNEREANVNLSELAQGVYLVRTFIGDRSRTEKLIKQ